MAMLLICSRATLADGVLLLAKTALAPHELAVIVNDADPLSREIADYYRRARAIPRVNLIHVRFEPGRAVLDRQVFAEVYRNVLADTPAHVQAYALAWTRPYRVGCLSITSAFATGYDARYCTRDRRPASPCGISGRSPYYATESSAPARDHGLRPTMLLAAETLEDARRLIDRGIAADASFPDGTAYLLSTSDRNRSVRDRAFAAIAETFEPLVRIEGLEQDQLVDRDDVLFYVTGVKRVAGLDSLQFLPGAVADHLTSAGGHMKRRGSPGQMSSLRWLEAGATGSYGTVIEPCNFTEKFPNPGLLMAYYLRGASLIEAYWKSVAWPRAGLFIGEPLAAPFSWRGQLAFEGSVAVLPPGALPPGHYALQSSEMPVGPYRDSGRTLSIGTLMAMALT
jgi:uncharacterized protein (TIGR03790 family)